MTEPRLILVTGATGNVGSATVAHLRASGVPVRSAARRQRQAANMVSFDFNDPDTFADALHDVDGILLIRPPAVHNMKRSLIPFLEEAARTGVKNVIFLSVIDPPRMAPHTAVEARLRTLPFHSTCLRAGFFMQNIADTYRTAIVERDELLVPAREARISWVDARDVGEAAARVLISNPSESSTYDLTGSMAISVPEVAAALSDAVGRPIAYRHPGPIEFATWLRRAGLPIPAIVIVSLLHRQLARGHAARVSPDLEMLLNRRARTISDYLHDYAGLFAKAGTQREDHAPATE